MRAQGVVVADTTPLNYLILIGQTEVLRLLFSEVMVPEAVITVLRHPKAPAAVTAWLQKLPHWLRVVKVAQVDDTIRLGQGETEAISLAIDKAVSIVLMDERRLIDGVSSLESLKQTTFRADPELLDRFEDRMKTRKA